MMRLRRAWIAAGLLGLVACGTHPPAPVVDRTAARPVPAVEKPPAATPQVAPLALPEGFYVVKRGDTLYSIALEHGADYRELAQWNSLEDPTRIKVGQQLRVKPPPEERRAQVGKPTILGRIESRPLDAPPQQQQKEAAVAPKAEPPVAPKAEPPVTETVDFIWPAKGKILAGFAEPRSKGIDIDGKLGDPVVAAAAGRVTYIGSGIPGLGKLVVIKHDNGFITVYAHNRDIMVKEQQSVSRGQKIAELGSSDSDRPKLHFQIRKGSAAVDPLRYLPAL